MDQDQFKAMQPLLDKIAELAEKQFNFEELRRTVVELGNIVGLRKTVSVSIVVDVFDAERECSLPLLTTGLSVSSGEEPFRTWSDSSPQRYVVDGGIQMVPHDRCPKCWQCWDFKGQNSFCPNCGITMGDECKLLLDTDQCPSCNEGRVTISKPQCDKCGYVVDPKKVVWG